MLTLEKALQRAHAALRVIESDQSFFTTNSSRYDAVKRIKFRLEIVHTAYEIRSIFEDEIRQIEETESKEQKDKSTFLKHASRFVQDIDKAVSAEEQKSIVSVPALEAKQQAALVETKVVETKNDNKEHAARAFIKDRSFLLSNSARLTILFTLLADDIFIAAPLVCKAWCAEFQSWDVSHKKYFDRLFFHNPTDAKISYVDKKNEVVKLMQLSYPSRKFAEDMRWDELRAFMIKWAPRDYREARQGQFSSEQLDRIFGEHLKKDNLDAFIKTLNQVKNISIKSIILSLRRKHSLRKYAKTSPKIYNYAFRKLLASALFPRTIKTKHEEILLALRFHQGLKVLLRFSFDKFLSKAYYDERGKIGNSYDALCSALPFAKIEVVQYVLEFINDRVHEAVLKFFEENASALEQLYDDTILRNDGPKRRANLIHALSGICNITYGDYWSLANEFLKKRRIDLLQMLQAEYTNLRQFVLSISEKNNFKVVVIHSMLKCSTPFDDPLDPFFFYIEAGDVNAFYQYLNVTSCPAAPKEKHSFFQDRSIGLSRKTAAYNGHLIMLEYLIRAHTAPESKAGQFVKQHIDIEYCQALSKALRVTKA